MASNGKLHERERIMSQRITIFRQTIVYFVRAVLLTLCRAHFVYLTVDGRLKITRNDMLYLILYFPLSHINLAYSTFWAPLAIYEMGQNWTVCI